MATITDNHAYHFRHFCLFGLYGILGPVTFRTLLRRIQKTHFGTVRAFAKALKIAPSHLSRAMGAHGQPFDIRACLRLAQVTGESPTTILRAAGKGDLAKLIEELYGAPPPLLTVPQRELLEAWDRMPEPARQALFVLAREAGGVAGPRGGTTEPTPNIPPTPNQGSGYHMDPSISAARSR
jgi:hypothetical protein